MSDVPEVFVPVKSAWASKINWVQVAGIVFSAAAAILGGGYIGLTPTQTATALAVLNMAQGAVTIILRTFFSENVIVNSLSSPGPGKVA